MTAVYEQKCDVIDGASRVVLLLLYNGQLMPVDNINNGGRSIGR